MVSQCHKEIMFQGSHGWPWQYNSIDDPKRSGFQRRGGVKSLTEVGSREMRGENGDTEHMIFSYI